MAVNCIRTIHIQSYHFDWFRLFLCLFSLSFLPKKKKEKYAILSLCYDHLPKMAIALSILGHLTQTINLNAQVSDEIPITHVCKNDEWKQRMNFRMYQIIYVKWYIKNKYRQFVDNKPKRIQLMRVKRKKTKSPTKFFSLLETNENVNM